MADILEQTVMTPTRLDGVPWLDHHRRALKLLEANLPAVIAHLSEIRSDQRKDIEKCDAAKVRGWLNKIRTHNFLLHMGFYIDVLAELSHLSLTFQKDGLSLPTAVEAVSITGQVLKDMVKHDGQTLTAIKMACETGVYRGIELTGQYTEAKQKLKMSREGLINDLVACLDERFQSKLSSDTVLQAMLKFDTKLWPESDDDLATYGNEEIPLLLEHFKEVWPQISQIWSEQFPNLLHVIEIIQVLPVSTSKVERAFSLLKRIKTDWRINLKTNTIENLMHISLEGPHEEDAVGIVEGAVKKWFQSAQRKRCLLTLPYGKRAQSSTSAAAAKAIPDIDNTESESDIETYEQ
ncbi:hypothetical protein ABVT39_012581 [Epinephelus coioides]